MQDFQNPIISWLIIAFNFLFFLIIDIFRFFEKTPDSSGKPIGNYFSSLIQSLDNQIIMLLFVFLVVNKILIDYVISSAIAKFSSPAKATATHLENPQQENTNQVLTLDELYVLTDAFDLMSQNLWETTEYVINICESMVESLIVVTTHFIIQSVNQATCQLLGYEKEELVGQPIAMVLAEEIFLGNDFNKEHFTTEGFVHNLETFYRTKEGRNIPVVLSRAVMQGKKGEIQGIVCVAQDISERKQAELALTKAKEELEIRVDERTAELASVIHQLQTEISERKRAETALKAAKEELEARVQERTAQIRSANEKLQQEIAVSRTALSARKQAEKELEQSLSLLRATLESTADGILVVDTEGKIISFNQKFQQMWRIPESIMATQESSQLLIFVLDQLKDPETFLSTVMKLYSQPEAESDDILEFKDGSVIERYSQPQRIGGKVVGRVWSFRNVTERKSAEQALRESERRLRKQNWALAELAKSQTLNWGNLNAALREITEAAARTLEVERTSVWVYNEERSKIHCLTLYERSLDDYSAGRELATVDYPAYFQALEEERTIAAHNAQLDPRTQEFSQPYLAVLGITSILNAPIWVRGKMVGVVCHEHIGPTRKWAMEEQNFAAAIADLVALAMEAHERRRSEATVRYQATHDLLTGLPNRILFSERLELAMTKAQSEQTMLAVCFLDLDRFKTINDTLGHACGDQLLQGVVERLTSCLRSDDIVARWAGDEFTLLLSHIRCQQDAAKIAQKILDALKPTFNLEGYPLHVTSSIGIAFYPLNGEDGETLIKNADAALYRAKEQGGNAYQLYDSTMNSKAAELLVIEQSLHDALERGEFRVYYQPQVNTKTGEITQMEALVRWQHPTLGFISPSTFIPLAEENGLIVPIGEWVLRTACTQNKAWQDAGLPPICIAVNLSARQFQQPNLVEMVARVIEETGLDPEFLELEITESTVMQNVDFTKSILRNLHEMGVHISMDDFGTGYSSLSYLKKFPLDKLKIDQSFVRELTTDPSDAAIISAIVALGKVLNLRVVAEGVETEEHKDLLRSLQCREMQGYFFSPPLSAEEAAHQLKNPWSIKMKTTRGIGVSGSCFGFKVQ